jgi:DNA-binding transcriptional ArsR family regulator
MSNVLTPPFIPFTTDFKEAMYSLPTGLYKVYDFIASEIFRWKDSRVTLEKELACSFISARINLSVSSVSRAIKKLKALGYIKIVKEGVKGVGSIIRLMPCKFAQMTCKNAKNTPAEMQGNKKTINIKKNNNKVVDVSLNSKLRSASGEQNINPENNNSFSSVETIPEEREKEKVFIHPEKINIFGREVNNISNYPLPQEEYKELLPSAGELGIKPALLSSGIKTLTKRECHNLKSTLKDIFSQLQCRYNSIKNKAAYFITLCKEIELTAPIVSTEEVNSPGGFRPIPDNLTSGCSSPLPVEAPPVDPLQQKRKEFADKISSGFRIGAIKYVLSPAGISQPIITCSSDGFSYLKEGHLRNAYWNELPEKLLNEVFFVGDEYFTEITLEV